MITEHISKAGGDYVLLVRVSHETSIKPGRLGAVEIPCGWALYLGSARGPGGLQARLARHVKPARQKRTHWHIDYLTATFPIEEIWWLNHEIRRECRWAKIAAEIGQPIHSFGASDCDCYSHLISLGSPLRVKQVWTSLLKDGHGMLKRTVLVQETTP
jgi:Uri superfamily endonuclease